MSIEVAQLPPKEVAFPDGLSLSSSSGAVASLSAPARLCQTAQSFGLQQHASVGKWNA